MSSETKPPEVKRSKKTPLEQIGSAHVYLSEYSQTVNKLMQTYPMEEHPKFWEIYLAGVNNFQHLLYGLMEEQSGPVVEKGEWQG